MTANTVPRYLTYTLLLTLDLLTTVCAKTSTVTLPTTPSTKPRKLIKGPSTISKLLPLITLLVFTSILAFIGYVVYDTVTKAQGNVNKQLDKNNVKLSRTGANIKVKGMSYEEYKDKTQSVFVNAFQNSEAKDFKSRIFTTGDAGKPKQRK